MMRRVTREEVERDKRMTLIRILASFILVGVFIYFLFAITGIIK